MGAHRGVAVALTLLAGAFATRAAEPVRGAGKAAAPPTTIDVSGGDGTAGGGAGGRVELSGAAIRLGSTKVKASKIPKAPRAPELVIGDADWDDVDGGAADLDPLPDRILVSGDILVEGTLVVDGNENLVSDTGSIFIAESGAIVWTGAGFEDDGAPGPDDDDAGQFLNLLARKGDLTVLGTVDVSGTGAGSDGGNVVFIGRDLWLGRRAVVDASGADGSPGGDGGQVNFDDTGLGLPQRVVAAAGSTIDVSGGDAAEGPAGDAGALIVDVDSPAARNRVVLLGEVHLIGGAGDSGGAGGVLRVLAGDVFLGGEIVLRGGPGEAGPGGAGGWLDALDVAKRPQRLGVVGTKSRRPRIDATGGAASAGTGGLGGAVFGVSFAFDLDPGGASFGLSGSVQSDADVLAAGGDGATGGGGGAVALISFGPVTNRGAIDVSGGDGTDGAGGDAGAASGILDPAEAGRPAHRNFLGVQMSSMDDAVVNSGAILASGGDAGNVGDGGDGADVAFRIDSDGSDAEVLGEFNDFGGVVAVSGEIRAEGGDTAGGGAGGDGGDVTADADPDDDEAFPRRRRRTGLTGTLHLTGGNATGTGDFAGGDGGDALLRATGDFLDRSTITNTAGANVGAPTSPAAEGTTTVD